MEKNKRKCAIVNVKIDISDSIEITTNSNKGVFVQVTKSDVLTAFNLDEN